MGKFTILLMERDNALSQGVRRALADFVIDIRTLHDRGILLPTLQQVRPRAVIIGPSQDGAWDELSVAREVRQADTTIPVILVTRHSTEDRAIRALKLHVNDYFTMPLATKDFSASVRVRPESL